MVMKVLVALQPSTKGNQAHQERGGGGPSEVDSPSVRQDVHLLSEVIGLKSAVGGSEIIAVSTGGLLAGAALEKSLALGADRAIFVPATDELQPFAVAKILRAVAFREGAAVVVCSSDGDDAHQVASLVAGMANASHKDVRGGHGLVELASQSDASLTKSTRSGEGVLRLVVTLSSDAGSSVHYAAGDEFEHSQRVEVASLTHLGIDIAPRLQKNNADWIWAAEKVEPIRRSDVALVIIGSTVDEQCMKQTISAADQVGLTTDVLVDGSRLVECKAICRRLFSVCTITTFQSMADDRELAWNVASHVERIPGRYTHVLAPDSASGRKLITRLAAIFAVAPILGVRRIVGARQLECWDPCTGDSRDVLTRDQFVLATISTSSHDRSERCESPPSVWDWRKSATLGAELVSNRYAAI
jgi:hypothetical protein